MSVGEQTVSDASPQRGEVGRGAQRGRCTPRLLARLGFPPPASPRWGEVQDGGHVAGGASARASPLFPIMSILADSLFFAYLPQKMCRHFRKLSSCLQGSFVVLS